MNKAKLENIRAAVKALKAQSSRPRYTEEIKGAARELFREGLETREVCNEIGIGAGTLSAWAIGLTERQFRKVKVNKRIPPDSGIKVVLASGASIEISSFDLLKEILVILK